MNKRKECARNEQEQVEMTQQNLKVCVGNMEEGYSDPTLNDSLHLQFYGFVCIANLQPFCNLNTLFLNNNTLTSTQGLNHLAKLRTLNLAYNAIPEISSLNELTLLHTLDLTHNRISSITSAQVEGLNSLATLKIGHNRLTTTPPLQPLPALTCLDISHNIQFACSPQEHQQYLNRSKISVLTQSGTPIPKDTPSYRKTTICNCPTLLYLDDRPVTADERALAEAWKEGGFVLEKQVRARIQEKKQEKHEKLYSEIEHRLKEAEDKRDQAFKLMTQTEREELERLKSEQSRQQLLVQELERYLQLVRGGMGQVDVNLVLGGGEPVLPTMVVDKVTPTTIYVYNITNQQLPLVKAKYYPEEQREIVAVNNPTKKAPPQWMNEHRQMLTQAYQRVGSDLTQLTAAFNLAQYELNPQGSTPTRYSPQEIQSHLDQVSVSAPTTQQTLDELD